MRRFISARLSGLHKPRVIGVFTGTEAETDLALSHVCRGAAEVPVRVWRGGRIPLREVRLVWLALSIVAWTGRTQGGRSMGSWKLLPLFLPPFRVLVLNEAGDFFRATPRSVAGHAARRFKDWFISGLRRLQDVVAALPQWAGSVSYRAGERIIDAFRLVWSLIWRAAERTRDVYMLLRSLLLRAADRTIEFSLTPVAEVADLVPKSFLRSLIVMHERDSAKAPSLFEPGGTVEVHLTGRRWPRRRIEAALRTGGAEFIVLRREGEEASAQPLIRLAGERSVFAVARQGAWSRWRSRVVAKHPFRRLQAGEVSNVLAPWSNLIAFRCDTFLRLGCPRAWTAGAALTVLFRRSAAAGLRTIVAGHDGPVTDEPAMGLEDCEFALRAALSPSLGRLAPVDPAVARGNIAFSPAHRRGFRGLPRVLVASPYLPFPLSHGGAVRIWNLCRELSRETDFVLACFHEAEEHIDYEKLHEVFREVFTVDIDTRNSDPSVPRQVAEYRNSAMASLIAGMCLEKKIDILQLEYTQMATYSRYAAGLPVILVEHDITCTLYEQLAALKKTAASANEARLWRDFEREALQTSTAVWTMSQMDRKTAVAHGAVPDRTMTVPNGVDLSWYRPSADTSPGSPVVLFAGSFRHLPNLLAFEVLRETIMPRVWKSHPSAELHVVAGPDYENAANAAGESELLRPVGRISIRGFVSDMRPVYRNADVVAVPLPLSAGTNIKVMEAMACGLPIVSTTCGCQGLGLDDGCQILVADDPGEFAAAVSALLDNPGLRARLGAQARKAAEERFGWDTIARQASDCYSGLLSQRPHSDLLSQRPQSVSGSTSALTTPGAGD